MTDITTHIKTILQQQGNAHAHDGEYEIVCECDASRKKQGEKKLKVWVQADGMCSWNCTHCGVKGGSPIFRNGDTAPSEKTKPKEPEYELPREIKYDRWTEEAALFMKSRGFTADTISAMGVFFCNNFAFGKEGDAWITPPAIVFPYYENDMIVNYKIRAIDKKDFRQAKGVNKKPCRPTLYNIDRVYKGWGKKKEIIICEGEFDVMAFFEAGFPNAVSNPIGASGDAKKQTQQQIKKANESKALIYANYPYLKNADRIIFAGDNDAVGKGLQGAIADVLGRENCYYVDWGEYKDANDVLIAHGKEGIISVMDNIKPLPIAKEPVVDTKPAKQKPVKATAKEQKPNEDDAKKPKPPRDRVIDAFMNENPDLCIIQHPRDEEPSGYVEWRDGVWHFLTKTQIKDRINIIALEIANTAKLRNLIQECFAVIQTRLRFSDTATTPEEWNKCLGSIPLKDGNKSVLLDKQFDIVDTPREDKNYDRLPITASELTDGFMKIEDGSSGWIKMLLDWHPKDREKINFLQISCGQALLGNPAQMALLITGRGGDGKSTFIDCIRNALEKPFVDTTPPEVYLKTGNAPMKESAKLGLRYARFSIVPEIDDPANSWRGGSLKDISAGDTSSARPLYKEYIEITPRVLPIICGNYLPRSRDAGISMQRRLKVVEFTTTQHTRKDALVGSKRADVLKKIRGEVLAWLLIGARDWVREYKDTTTRVYPCKSVIDASDEYFLGEDDFMYIFREICEESEGGFLHVSDFQEAFRNAKPDIAKRLGVDTGRIGKLIKERPDLAKDYVKRQVMGFQNWRLKASYNVNI